MRTPINVHLRTMVPPEAPADYLEHEKLEHYVRIAEKTAPGGEHYREGAKYTWPPTQEAEEVEWPSYHDDEHRHKAIRITTILEEIIDE